MKTEESKIEFPRQKTRRENVEEWKSILEGFKSSNQSQSEYCRENNINYSVFLYWKRKLLKPRSVETEIKIVELKNCNDSLELSRSILKPTGSLRLWIDGLCIEIGEGFSSAVLIELLRVLRSH